MADIPAEEEIKLLPRWAIVAFAARCAANVQFYYWLPVDHLNIKRHVQAVDKAIKLTDDDDATAVTIAAYSAYTAAYDATASNTACTAAYAAAYAADAYAAAKTGTDSYARAAYTAATNAAHSYAVIRIDFDYLLEQSTINGWTDDTQVNHWKVLGPLWSDGVPKRLAEGCKWHERILGRPLYGPDGLPFL